MPALDHDIPLEEDWASIKVRGESPKPKLPENPGLDEDWAAVRGVPDHVYYLSQSANRGMNEVQRLPLPQLWRYKVIRQVHQTRFRDNRGWEVRAGILLWTPEEHFTYHHPNEIPQSESYRTLAEACAALKEERDGYIASLQADITRYEQRAAEFQEAARCTQEAVEIIQSLDLTVREHDHDLRFIHSDDLIFG